VPALVGLVALTRPEDRLALVDGAVARQPMQPALRRARFPLLGERARVDEVHALVATVLPATIEAQGDARAQARFLATLLGESPSEVDAGTRALAEAIVHACATSPAVGPCGTPTRALQTSMRLLRRARAISVVKDAPRLSDEDLADAPLRLEIVLSLLDRGAVNEAAAIASDKRGRWDGPESSLGKASVDAAQGRCTDATASLSHVGPLESAYAADVRWVRERCSKSSK
jgi:hypothetical protein